MTGDAAEAEGRRTIRSRLSSLTSGAPLLPLLLLFGLNAVDELDRTAFEVLLPEIRDDFGLGNTGILALVALIVPAQLLVAVPVARRADRRRRVPIALVGASAWGIFSLLTGFAFTLAVLISCRMGAGLGRAVNDPVHASLLSDYYPPTNRARIFSVHRAANTVGGIAGPLTAGFLAEAVGWRVPFIALAVPTLVLVVLGAVLLREPARTGINATAEGTAQRFRDSFKLLWGTRTLRQIFFAFPFLAFATIGRLALQSIYYEEIFGVGPRVRGMIQAFDAPFIIVGLFVLAPVFDRGIVKDPGRVMRRIGLTATALGVFMAGVGVAPALWVAIAFNYGIVTLGIVLLAGGFAIVSLIAPPEARASAFAFFGIASLLGVVALPIVGQIADAVGVRWAYAAIAPMMLLGAIVVSFAGRYANEDIKRVYPDVSEAGAGPSTLVTEPGI